MGNLLADCRRCSPLESCELCTDVQALRSGRGSTTRHASLSASGEAAVPAAQAAGGNARAGGRRGQDYAEASSEEGRWARSAQAAASGSTTAGALIGDEDPHLMAAIAASYASGVPGRATLSEEELVAQAIRKAQHEEEARQRARLRLEQETEYEESLRIDQQREMEKALRKKEEEEAARRKAEEEEAKRMIAEREAAEAAEAEAARKRRAEAATAEARALLEPEPADTVSNRAAIMVRIPDGRRIKRAFETASPVAQVYYFVIVEGGEALAAQSFRLVSAMPRRTYEDRSATLESVGLKGQCALLVEVIDDE